MKGLTCTHAEAHPAKWLHHSYTEMCNRLLLCIRHHNIEKVLTLLCACVQTDTPAQIAARRHHDNGGAIAGAVIGGVAAIGLVTFAIIAWGMCGR